MLPTITQPMANNYSVSGSRATYGAPPPPFAQTLGSQNGGFYHVSLQWGNEKSV